MAQPLLLSKKKSEKSGSCASCGVGDRVAVGDGVAAMGVLCCAMADLLCMVDWIIKKILPPTIISSKQIIPARSRHCLTRRFFFLFIGRQLPLFQIHIL